MDKQGTNTRKRPSVKRSGGVSYKKQQAKLSAMIMMGMGTVPTGFNFIPSKHPKQTYGQQRRATQKRNNIRARNPKH